MLKDQINGTNQHYKIQQGHDAACADKVHHSIAAGAHDQGVNLMGRDKE